MDGYVTKPVDLDILIETIQSVLSGRPKHSATDIAIDAAPAPKAFAEKSAAAVPLPVAQAATRNAFRQAPN